MSMFQNNIDLFMSLTWILTYALVLISMLKTDKPVMPPIACAVIFPWEFVATADNLLSGADWNYAVVAQLAWALLEVSIIAVLLLRIHHYEPKQIPWYFAFLICNIGLLAWIFTLPNGMFYMSYIVTIIGVLFWVAYTAKPCYPRTELNFHVLMVKLCADILGMIAYYNYDIVGFVLAVLLPLIDIAHIIVFFAFAPKEKADVAVEEALK